MKRIPITWLAYLAIVTLIVICSFGIMPDYTTEIATAVLCIFTGVLMVIRKPFSKAGSITVLVMLLAAVNQIVLNFKNSLPYHAPFAELTTTPIGSKVVSLETFALGCIILGCTLVMDRSCKAKKS